MKKLLKIAFVLLGIGLVLAVAAAVALRVLLPPEKAKALVLAQLEKQLRREVRLGEVSVGLLRGLHLTDLQISEHPDFSKGTFISGRGLTLRVALVPLLFKKIIVRHLVLEKPAITVIRQPDGKTFNFSDLTGAPAPAPTPASPPAATKPSSPYLFLVTQARIADGTLRFIDRSPAAQSLEIQPFNLTLKNVSLTAPFGLDLAFGLKRKNTAISFDLQGQADLLAGAFRITKGRVTSGESKLNVSGAIGGVTSGQPSVDLSLDIPGWHVAALQGWVELPPDVRIEGPITGRATVKGRQAKLDFDALLDFSNARVHYARQFAKPEKTPFTLALQGTLARLDDLSLRAIKVGLARLEVKGHGRAQAISSAQPALALQLDSNAFPVADLLPLFPGLLPAGITLAGNSRFSLHTAGTPAALRLSLKADASDTVVTMSDPQTRATRFAKPSGVPLDATLLMEVAQPPSGALNVQVKSLAARLGSMRMTGVGSYQAVGKSTTVTLGIKTNTWPVQETAKLAPQLAVYQPSGSASAEIKVSGPLHAPGADGRIQLKDGAGKSPDAEWFGLSAGIDFKRPAGMQSPPLAAKGEVRIARLKMESYEGRSLQLDWDLTEITPDLSRVNGKAAFKQGPGKITTIEKMASGSRAGRLALLPLQTVQKLQRKGLLRQINLPSLETIPFDSARGDYTFRSGTMDIKTFDLEGDDLAIQVLGTIGLAGAQPLALKTTMKLAPGSLRGTLGELVSTEGGRPTFRFTVSGTMDDPKTRFEMQEIGQKAIQKAGEEILKNPQIKDAIEKGLQNIFK